MKYLRTLSVVGLALSGLLNCRVASACDTVISTFPYTIASAGSYCLAGDLAAHQAYGIAIAASDVNLDCRGYKIQSSVGGGTGIYVRAAGNIKVQNCNVEGFGQGISLAGANAQALNNTIRASGPRAITVSGNDSRIIGNRVLSVSTGTGWAEAMLVTDAHRSVVMNNVVTGVGGASSLVGLVVEFSNDVDVVGNQVLDLTHLQSDDPTQYSYSYAIGLRASSRAKLTHNTIMMRAPNVHAFSGIGGSTTCIGNLVIGAMDADFAACGTATGNVFQP